MTEQCDGEDAAAIRRAISEIANTLCDTVDNRFDLRVDVDTKEIEVQKLVMLVNFVLEQVRRNLAELEEARSKLEQRVEERTERLNLVIEGANDGVWEWTPDTDELVVSPRFLEQVQRTDANPVMNTAAWVQLIHKRDVGQVQEAIQRVLDGRDRHLRVEFRLRPGPAKGERLMIARGAAMQDEHGRVERLAGTQTDITERYWRLPESGLFTERAVLAALRDHQHEQRDAMVIMMRTRILGGAVATSPGSDHAQVQNHLAHQVAQAAPWDDLRIGVTAGDTLTAVVCGEIRPEDIAEQLRERLETTLVVEHQRLWLQPAVGIVHTATLDHRDPERALEAARMAMRSARAETGGTVVRVYSKALEARARSDREAEDTLAQAIRNNWITAFLQPVVDIHAGTVHAFEALMRLHHPEHGILSPGAFIAAAERTGVMGDVSHQAFRAAGRSLACAHMTTTFGDSFLLSLNIAPEQLAGRHAADELLAALEALELSPGRVQLEVTERSLLEDPTHAADVLEDLRAAGVTIAMDDFGTGYSSLGYLQQLPLDVLKIDKSLVDRVPSSGRAYRVLDTIVRLAEDIGLDVVIEGIETDAQLHAVGELDVRLCQGFLLSRPHAIDEVLEQNLPEHLRRLRIAPAH
ncbi:EAL domain-containing protein [Aquisalimonas sp. 2447]|uniref:GGDEF domain-containing phosphodiesterase n=1 Tax=Aquisalimonas sp. 2447 TaxID=2740807 RepID=UPI0014324176|nr:GGDEF domain-containing phosphodiesterase [Aquisalimonas sp. 2447]QIT55086.1 EAL domain-containing protein [Aquisalimonas sp. 2447]